MKELKTASLLFAQVAGVELSICPGIKGGMSSGDPTTFSKVRPPASATAQSKISTVAWAAEEMLSVGAGKFSKLGKDMVYGEWGSTQAVMQDLTITAPSTLSPGQITEIWFALELVKGNEELAEAFKAVRAAFDGKKISSSGPVFTLCDTFYFGAAKGVSSVYLNTMDISAVLRSNVAQPIEALRGLKAYKPTGVRLNAAEPVKSPAKNVSALYEAAKKGDYVVPFKWGEEQEMFRQELSSLDGYVPCKQFVDLLAKIKYRTDKIIARLSGGLDVGSFTDRVKAIGSDYVNVTLSGKPGTGKTRLAYALAAATGMPIYTVSISHNTEEDDLTGMTKMVDGKPSAVATDAVRCFEEGGILLLEEINLANPAVIMGALGQAVEFPFILKKDGYIPVRRHPLCVIISTMNTGTMGSKVLSQPFANRFKQSFILDDPVRKDFIRILANATGAEDRICGWIYDAYARIVACVEDDNAIADVESILLSLSMRSCVGAIECIQEGMSPIEAIDNSIIGKIAEQDREVAKNCRDTVLSSLVSL